MVGKNWDDIQIKFTENQKYTSKDSKLNDKVKEESEKSNKEIDTTLKETDEQISNDVKSIKEDEKKEKENAEKENTENEETSLVKTTEFQEKHPRLAKIFAAIKKILPRKSKKQENIIEQEVKENNTKQKETKTQRDEFLDYLKVVSEKGVNQANKDEAKAKLTENKKAAYARETEKFGKEYAERSYKEDIEIDDKHTCLYQKIVKVL